MFVKSTLKNIVINRINQICRQYNSQILQDGVNVPRRALLYVPGDDERKIKKTLSLDVDCIAMDCEDGVAINKKKMARETIRKTLEAGKPKKSRNYDWGVRVNSVSSGLLKEDLESILTSKFLPDTVSLPKVQSTEDLKIFSSLTSKYINDNRRINLIIFIESALAMINLVNICESAIELSKASKFDPVALLFGSDDLCASIGASRSNDAYEIVYARQKLVLVAKAFNFQAIDMVHIQYKDMEGLKRNSEQGARMGYTGKQVIHPDQVPIVQSSYIPNKNQIEWAQGLIAAFNEYQKSGKGAFVYKGSMIDMPTMKQAQNIMNLLNNI